MKPKSLLLLSLLILLIIPLLASAHGLVPCGGSGENPCTVQDIFSLIARVTNWLIYVAGIYAVFQIVKAGFWLIISMGNEESITKWRGALTQAVVGFVFVMLAYILINTAVNYILLDGAPCSLKVNLTDPLGYVTGSNSCPASSTNQ